MDKARARQLYELADRLSQVDVATLSEKQLSEREQMIARLQQELDEGWKDKLAAGALAATMALGAGAAHGRVVGGQDQDPGINRLTGKPIATQVQQADQQKANASKGFSKEYLQKAANPDRVGRFLISVEQAQQMLQQMGESVEDEITTEAYERLYRVFDFSNFKVE